jgi:hypothetical protein
MSDYGDYRDKVELNELTDGNIELLLSGREPPEPGNEELVEFLSDVKAVYARGPAEQTARDQVAALVDAAERTAVQKPAPPARRELPSKRRLALPKKRLALLTAAVVLGILLLLAGLAAAGVKFPGVVRAPFDGIGIQLPNQARADPVKGAHQSTAPDQRDCSFGQRTAGTANAGRGGPPENPCSRQVVHGTGPGPDGDRHPGRSFRQQTSASAHHGASHEVRASGEQSSQAERGSGQAQASSSPPPEPETPTGPPQQPQAPTGPPQQPQAPTGPPQSETGRGIAEQQSQTGQAVGPAQSQAGMAKASQASGGHGP